MKMMLRIALMVALLTAGFAAGYPVGRSSGFSTGSEWALLQANILAREAGLYMPVKFEAGQFRITLKQPKHLYRAAWVLADRHEDALAYWNGGDGALSEHMPRTRYASLPQ